MKILAIDPGVHFCGWALFGCGERPLTRCGYTDVANAIYLSEYAGMDHTVVVERPQADGRPARLRDLLDLAVVAGQLAGSVGRLVTPRQWKGNVPKAVCHARLFGRIPQATIDACIPSVLKSKRHNVYDAVALGLWALEHPQASNPARGE